LGVGVGVRGRRRKGKVLEIELMKEERVAWEVREGGIVVGGFEEEGWGEGGMDEVSLVGLALERLGRGRWEEGVEMMR